MCERALLEIVTSEGGGGGGGGGGFKCGGVSEWTNEWTDGPINELMNGPMYQ